MHPDPEPNSDGWRPIAIVANIINVAANMTRRFFDLIFMGLLPAQMIVGRDDQVKTNVLLPNKYTLKTGVRTAADREFQM